MLDFNKKQTIPAVATLIPRKKLHDFHQYLEILRTIVHFKELHQLSSRYAFV
jgi:hypothetical protein